MKAFARRSRARAARSAVGSRSSGSAEASRRSQGLRPMSASSRRSILASARSVARAAATRNGQAAARLAPAQIDRHTRLSGIMGSSSFLALKIGREGLRRQRQFSTVAPNCTNPLAVQFGATLMDDRPASRVETTAAFIRGRIANRALARGARLPSVRELAVKLEVSKSTVVEAYDRLAAEGAVVARRGSGFFVAGASPPAHALNRRPAAEPAIDPSWINRHAMIGSPDFLCPGAGWLPDSWVLDLGVQRAMRLAARADPQRRRQYDEPLGYAPLRRLFSVRLAERGVWRIPTRLSSRIPARRRSIWSAAFFSVRTTRWSSTTPAISISIRSCAPTARGASPCR